jgi:ribosomal protein S18 acetylase RimI-like enzyme
MELKLVECGPEYWNFVRELRQDGRVVDGFIETTIIEYQQQQIYMQKYGKNYRIALVDGKPAGYVGVIEDDIRVCTHPDFQGMGVGKFMIGECMKIWPTAYAKVKHGNTASDKLFLSCGFEVSGKDERFTYYKLKTKMVSLKSSITQKGKYVSKILHFVGGEKRTFNGVDTDSIKQGQFTKFETKDGRLVMVNDKNILCIEIINEND